MPDGLDPVVPNDLECKTSVLWGAHCDRLPEPRIVFRAPEVRLGNFHGVSIAMPIISRRRLCYGSFGASERERSSNLDFQKFSESRTNQSPN